MTSRSEVLTIERSLPSERLDTYLRDKFPAVSRGAIQRLIEQGDIRVNGRIVKPTHTPRTGEQVEVHWPEARAAVAQPEAIPLNILYEDEASSTPCFTIARAS
ncbi:MAG: S4 domain-containing protein [Verrucomicrobia bacterium]|nr:S4 domain-containing protein [Verrucomicrobiota bacterium]